MMMTASQMVPVPLLSPHPRGVRTGPLRSAGIGAPARDLCALPSDKTFF